MVIPSPHYQLSMAPNSWNSNLGELCSSHRLMSMKVLLVNECGSVLLGVHLLGDWKEAKPNGVLPASHGNEEWGSRGTLCPGVTCPGCVPWCEAAPTARSERGRGSRGAPPAQDRGAVRGSEVMFSVSSVSQQTSATCSFKSCVSTIELPGNVGARTCSTCVFAGGINAVFMWIFMSCCRNCGRRGFKKYQSPTPAIYLYAFCFLLHFLVYFCFNKAKRISPCSQSQRSCP